MREKDNIVRETVLVSSKFVINLPAVLASDDGGLLGYAIYGTTVAPPCSKLGQIMFFVI